MKRIMDLQLNIDGVILKDNESVEELISKIERLIDSHYKIAYEVLHTEVIE